MYSLGFQKAMDSDSGVDTGDEESVNPFKFPELSWKSAGSHFSTDILLITWHVECLNKTRVPTFNVTQRKTFK